MYSEETLIKEMTRVLETGEATDHYRSLLCMEALLVLLNRKERDGDEQT